MVVIIHYIVKLFSFTQYKIVIQHIIHAWIHPENSVMWGGGVGLDVVLVINIFHSLLGHTDWPSHGPPFFRGVHTRISRETIATHDFPGVGSRSPVPTAGSAHLFLKNC